MGYTQVFWDPLPFPGPRAPPPGRLASAADSHSPGWGWGGGCGRGGGGADSPGAAAAAAAAAAAPRGARPPSSSRPCRRSAAPPPAPLLRPSNQPAAPKSRAPGCSVEGETLPREGGVADPARCHLGMQRCAIVTFCCCRSWRRCCQTYKSRTPTPCPGPEPLVQDAGLMPPPADAGETRAPILPGPILSQERDPSSWPELFLTFEIQTTRLPPKG
jgi:hypothetical protein